MAHEVHNLLSLEPAAIIHGTGCLMARRSTGAGDVVMVRHWRGHGAPFMVEV
jgi:hypothetical protein